jgi:hypothetical protein
LAVPLEVLDDQLNDLFGCHRAQHSTGGAALLGYACFRKNPEIPRLARHGGLARDDDFRR